jgi:inner membrane protein YidH
MSDQGITSASGPSAISFELASRNTGLAVQRTRMSADRTLMSVIRTSLSLVSFGFTISQIFQKLTESRIVRGDSSAGLNFGVALVLIGIVMLVFGILYHLQFTLALRRARKQLADDGLIHGESPFPVSLSLITAVILLGISVAAILSMIFHVGPF